MDLTQIANGILLIVSFGVMAIGIGAVFFPQKASKQFGIEVHGDALPYVRATGARDIFIGLTLLILYWRHELLTAGYVCIAIASASSVDAFITWKKGTRPHSFFHIFGTVAIIVFGVWLISLHS